MITADFVKRSFRLLKGQTLSEEDAQAKADLLETKQELLAHLIVRAKAFEGEEKLKESLRK